MQNEERQLELIGATEFLDQGLKRLFRKFRVVRAGINQVTGVPKDDIWLVGKITITRQIGFRERLGSPLHVVLTKIWIAEHPIDRPRSRALAGPPAMDMCAPSKGFFTDGEAGLEERVRLPRFLAPRFGSLRPIRRNLPNRVLKGSGSAETERVLVDVACEVQGAVQQVQGSAQAERVRLRGDSKR